MSIEEDADLSEAPKSFPYEVIVPGGAVIKKGKIKKKQQVLHLKLKPMPRSFFVNKVLRIPGETKTIDHGLGPLRWTRYKKMPDRFLVRWNVFWAEALGKSEKVPTASDELTNLAVSDDMIQMRNGAAAITKFVLDSDVIKLMIVIFVFSIPFGLILNTLLNLVPAQVVHWLP